MDRGNNIGTYIFWGLVLCLVIALVVVFVVIIPKGGANQNLSNISEAENSFAEVLVQDYTLTNWTNEVINYDDISYENKSKLQYYQEIMFVYLGSDNFVETATSFVDRNEHFGELNRKQNEALKVVKEKIANIKDYIKTHLIDFLNDNNIDRDIANSQYISVYVNAYYELTMAYSEFFKVTADLIDKCATRCIEVNLLSITVYNSLTDACERLLALEEIDNAQLSSLQDLTNQYCDRDYYKEYYNSSSKVSEVSQAFAGVAGGV